MQGYSRTCLKSLLGALPPHSLLCHPPPHPCHDSIFERLKNVKWGKCFLEEDPSLPPPPRFQGMGEERRSKRLGWEAPEAR